MTKTKAFVFFAAAAAVLAGLASCDKSDDGSVPQVPDDKLEKVFVVNRGQDGRSGVSAIMRDNSVVDDILPAESSGTIRSVEVIQGKIWVVYDDPGKIGILHLTTHRQEAAIAHLTERTRFQYALLADDYKVAVSDAELRSVFFVDTRTDKIVKEIELGRPVGRMVENGTMSEKQTKLFVAGGDRVYTIGLSGTENEVQEIDAPASVASKPVCTPSLVWVLSPAALTGLARESGTPVVRYALDASGIDATNGFLSVDTNQEYLYFNAEKDGRQAVFSLRIASQSGEAAVKAAGADASEIEPTPLPDPAPLFYCDEVESLTFTGLSRQQTLYVCDARDGVSAGRVYEYGLDGKILNTFEVGVRPSELFFLR